MSEMDLQFQITLKRLAEISIAASLWNKDVTRQKMKEYFYKCDKLKAEDEWKKITQSVIQLLDPTSLPHSLYTDLFYIIWDIGMKISDWNHFINCMHLFIGTDRKSIYDKLMREIHWTHYGSIDGLKIFKSSWINDPGIDPITIHNIACLYCLDEVIPMAWKKISLELRHRLQIIKNLQVFGAHGSILAYWLARNDSSELERFNQAIVEANEVRFLNAEYSPEANMFLICARNGYRKAVEFFWEHISPEEQEKTLPIAWNLALEVIGNRGWIREFHRKEQFIETCIFLMKELDEYCVEKGINNELKCILLFGAEPKVVSKNVDNVMNLFLRIWPWPEFFMTVFNIVKPYFRKENYDRLLTAITDYMYEDYKLDFPVKNDLYRKMFTSVWQEKPASIKIDISYQFWFLSLDSSVIKMIFNDPLLNEREFLINQTLFYMLHGIQTNKTEKVDKFIDEMFTDLTFIEMKIFKWIIKDDFNSLKNLQRSYGKVEYNKLKSKIYDKTLVQFLLTKKEFDLADKYLNWRFDNKQSKIDSFKSELQIEQFSRNYIYNIWIKYDEEKAKEESDNYMKWFGKTPKDLRYFRQGSVVTDDMQYYDFNDKNEYRFYKPFVDAGRSEMVIPLLNWIEMKERYVKKFRKILIEDVPISDYLENNDIEKTERFLKWAFKTEKQKTQHLSFLIGSKRGVLSCKKFIAKVSNDDKIDDLAEVFKAFINFWIQPTGYRIWLRRKLIIWKVELEKLKKENESADNGFDPRAVVGENSDRSLNFDSNEIYCPENVLELFIRLLDSFDNAGEGERQCQLEGEEIKQEKSGVDQCINSYESSDSWTDCSSEYSDGTESSNHSDFFFDDDDDDDEDDYGDYDDDEDVDDYGDDDEDGEEERDDDKIDSRDENDEESDDDSFVLSSEGKRLGEMIAKAGEKSEKIRRGIKDSDDDSESSEEESSEPLGEVERRLINEEIGVVDVDEEEAGVVEEEIVVDNFNDGWTVE